MAVLIPATGTSYFNEIFANLELNLVKAVKNRKKLKSQNNDQSTTLLSNITIIDKKKWKNNTKTKAPAFLQELYKEKLKVKGK